MVLEVFILCAGLKTAGPFFVKSQEAVNELRKTELQEHPEFYPAGKCEIQVTDATQKFAAAESAARERLQSEIDEKVKEVVRIKTAETKCKEAKDEAVIALCALSLRRDDLKEVKAK